MLALHAAGVRHRYVKPRRPQQNGKVERSHRIDDEEFWSRHQFHDLRDAEAALLAWERRHNHERFSLALDGRTPAEKLRDLEAIAAERAALASHAVDAEMTFTGQDLDYAVHGGTGDGFEGPDDA